MTGDRVAGLLLAAGGGRRLGRPKAQVRFRGTLLAERGVRMLHDAGCDPVVAVLGAAADEVRAAADLSGAQVVVNDAWRDGQATSLRAGLAALRPTPAASVVVALVDQPLITAATVRRLIDAWRRARPLAVVATYGGRRGNPVLLDRRGWDDADASAVGDQGARGYLEQLGERLMAVPCDGTGRPDDIDTMADLEALASSDAEEEQSCS